MTLRPGKKLDPRCMWENWSQPIFPSDLYISQLDIITRRGIEWTIVPPSDLQRVSILTRIRSLCGKF